MRSARADGLLDQARETIDAQLLRREDRHRRAGQEPLQESLRRYEEHVRALESARQKPHGSLEEQPTLATNSAELQRETAASSRAPRAHQVRGPGES